MKVYTLTGKSGTGKSFQALNLCREKGIDGLIDDGLFIYKNTVAAGISAKRQTTKVGAIKTAVFNQEDHMVQVKNSIEKLKPEKLLILGTSDKMTDRIVDRLGLPKVEERIYIEDITSEADRETASKQRHQQGKHVIPVPAPQLKREFAGYFLDPMKLIRNIGGGRKKSYNEKTVVRPTFSYMGEFFISDNVIKDIAFITAENFPFIDEIEVVDENTEPDALKVIVSLSAKRGFDLFKEASEFQRELLKTVEAMTAFNVIEVEVNITSTSKGLS